MEAVLALEAARLDSADNAESDDGAGQEAEEGEGEGEGEGEDQGEEDGEEEDEEDADSWLQHQQSLNNE